MIKSVILYEIKTSMNYKFNKVWRWSFIGLLLIGQAAGIAKRSRYLLKWVFMLVSKIR